MSGLSFHSPTALQRYIFRSMQHPWLLQADATLTRQQRRARNVIPPRDLPASTVLYRSDGAARGQGGMDGSVQASYAAVRWEGGVITGRRSALVGDSTNNVAEYSGILSALNDAVARVPRLACFQTDSLLIARQISGRWRCRSRDLQPLYEEALELLCRLRRLGSVCEVLHIYREFNAEADSSANRALDSGHGENVSWLG